MHLGSLPSLSTKNETMAPLHVATLTELPKYEMCPYHHIPYGPLAYSSLLLGIRPGLLVQVL